MSLMGKVIISNNKPDIFSGDNINLIIEIENQEKLFIKANCQWDDLINRNKNGEIVYVVQMFKDRHILVDKHITILATDVLNKGKHFYNIVLSIDQKLPESVTWKYGSVRYELQLCLFSTKGADILYKMPLNVKRYSNICLEKDYMQPFHTAFKKYFCWGVCHTQPIKVILTLPKTCYLPGDSFSYLIKIENYSRLLDVQQISILLTQTQHYKVLQPLKSIKQIHTTLKQVKQNFGENHRPIKLHGLFSLPNNLVPSSLTACLINASYNLHFIFVFTGFQTDGIVSVPLKIGSHRKNLDKSVDLAIEDTILEMGGGDETTEYTYEV